MAGLLDIAQNQQRMLAARDAKAAERIAKAYRVTLRELRKDADTFRKEILRRERAGIPITSQRLDQMKQFDRLIVNTQERVDIFAARARSITLSEQRAAISIGANQTERMLAQTGRYVSKRAIPVGLASNGEPIDALFEPIGKQTADRLRSTIRVGLMNRTDPQLLTAQIDQILQWPASKARTIQRTESMEAGRAASQATMQANSHLTDGWYWYATLGSTTCAACWAMHGTKHKINEKMGSHPNCRCTMVPAIDGGERPERGRDLFKELPTKDQVTIAGAAAMSAMRDGMIELSDLVQMRRHETWGVGRYRGSLESALAKAEARRAGA